MKITIRKANKKDIDALAGLIVKLFLIEDDFRPDKMLQINALNMMIKKPDAKILVASAGKKVIGMATGQLVVSTAAGGFSLLLEDFFVEEEFRKKGIGSMLLNAMQQWAVNRGAMRIQLVCDERNENAVRFYLKKGLRIGSMRAMYKYI